MRGKSLHLPRQSARQKAKDLGVAMTDRRQGTAVEMSTVVGVW